MIIKILLIECSFAIPVALPNTYTNLHYGFHNFIVLFVLALCITLDCHLSFYSYYRIVTFILL